MTRAFGHRKGREVARSLTRIGDQRARSGFSLVELMIAIVILGLGLVMVATMFPVGWGRARDLGEFTQQQSITPAADNLARALLHSPGPSNPTQPTAVAMSFAGDLLYSEQITGTAPPMARGPVARFPTVWPSDTWVHALNMENIRVENPAFVAEDPWQIELALDPKDPGLNLDPSVIATSYMNPQIAAYQRLHPPLRQRRNITPIASLATRTAPPTATFSGDDDNWANRVATRRFAWAIFHRQPETLDPTPGRAAADRVIDMYYVTLRRPQSTNRYARQDPTAGLPDPYDITIPPVVPGALDADEDVMLPVAWRVQIELPVSIVRRFDSTGASTATNIPSVVQVPPEAFSGPAAAKRMLVTMFPRGTKFIDEIAGEVYTVARLRVEEPLGEKAFLTLDREIVLEDIDLGQNDPRCPGVCAPGVLDANELVRSVWVYPPPVQEREPGQPYPLFAGSTPVVDIDVQTITVTPDAAGAP